MPQSAFTLESLLETHDLPLIIIGADLRIVAVNRAWESSFGVMRQNMIGQPCCVDAGDCRHQRLFQTLEAYAGIFADDADANSQRLFSARGFPLLDADATLYLGETLTVLKKSAARGDESAAMIGKSAAFAQYKTRLQQAADTQAPVLLLGETGTGKELAAEFVHRHSRQAEGDFVIVDCTILGEELFESELFGHEKGAFTGATSAKKGLFELGNNGTLFFDEIGDLPLSQQPKLLRALESGQFRRVGGTAMQKANVRVVCATHRNLADMVKTGRFREDLFYRLSVFPVEVPPLRQRRQDLPLLIDHFLEQLSVNVDSGYAITQSALIKLMQYAWPGNIRELRNCLQLAAGLCKDKSIQEADIHFMQRQGSVEPVDAGEPSSDAHPLPVNSMAQFEAEFINSLISKYQGNRKLIAAEMNISERTLYRKLNRLNLT
ncbi:MULTISPECIES: sigma-54 interaction domain-containing protein [Methylomonas]|uniref:Fis family transcriptional regulator n=2 Tax=Methylomonas TaxID=416 RepID=A0A126T170_9GAMM|nr:MULTISPECIES: sigma-54 dependent transcriptional regulator [Methylomonas]AMK75829.1 Fis family transcriptional regulator [Methylomonas denitrificans]OAH98583.1 Fis family transcriptional regulator [Methylomonas methanica]TCV80187.1 Fis family sigma54 specific transcriptional regulator [Methylomonas methanica]